MFSGSVPVQFHMMISFHSPGCRLVGVKLRVQDLLQRPRFRQLSGACTLERRKENALLKHASWRSWG